MNEQQLMKTVQTTLDVAKISYSFAKTLGFVEVVDAHNSMNSQKISLSDDEQSHLLGGGTLLICHACGSEYTVKLPRGFSKLL